MSKRRNCGCNNDRVMGDFDRNRRRCDNDRVMGDFNRNRRHRDNDRVMGDFDQNRRRRDNDRGRNCTKCTIEIVNPSNIRRCGCGNRCTCHGNSRRW